VYTLAPVLGYGVENHSATLYASVAAIWGIATALPLFSAVCGTVILIVVVSFSFHDPLGSLAWDTAVIGTFFVLSRLLFSRKRAIGALAATTRELEQSRQAEAHAQVELERARIARDLHDVVAHAVSIMVVQTGAAQRMIDADPRRAHAALDAVLETGREALGELRSMLGMLHPSADDAPLSPQPGLADLPALVQRLHNAGLDVALNADPEPDAAIGAALELGPGADLAAYRVVQESLTNVVKHGHAARAEVNVHRGPDGIEIEVRDNGRAASSTDVAGAGHGLIGMRERLSLYGGTLESGPIRPHGFRVRAVIPWEAAR
jgi:signal transduction histidine kinase